MLSRANLLGRVQSSDAKCLVNRRLLEVDEKSSRHGSYTRIQLVDLRKTGGLVVSGRRPRLPKTHCSKVLEKGSGRGRTQRIILAKDVPSNSSIAHKEQIPIVEPRGGVSKSTIYAEKISEGLLWKSAKNISLGRVQSRSDELNFIENVEACFSQSSSITLVPQKMDEDDIRQEVSLAADDSSGELSATTYEPRRGRRGLVETTLRKIWKKKKEERRIGGLLLLNGLAAVYGSSNVANKFVAEAAPTLPASLTSLVRFTSALIFFVPSLVSAVRNRETALLRAGAELGAIGFTASFVDSCNPGGSSSSSPSLLFAFTVIFVPLMELFAGRRSGPNLSRLATIAAAILGMGVLEEEGLGWKGISCPQISDLWGVAVSVISTLHIFRSEAHGEKFDPLRLNAVQCGVLAILSLGWEVCSTFDASALKSHVLDIGSLQSIPWVPLLYNGLVCSGLGSLLELRGLRSVHASTATLVYTTIPVWGAFLSSFTSHDVPAESAIIGGLVIAATSMYAQSISKHEEAKSIDELEFSATSVGTSNENADPDAATAAAASGSEANNYFPAGLLVSQLKFPYYAAQAKGLLAEIKLKLGALKSMGLVFTGVSSSSLLPAAPSSPSSVAVNPSSSSAATSYTPTTTTGATGLTTSQHIGAAASHSLDASNVAAGAAVHTAHGTDLATTAALSAAHGGSSSVLAHLSASFATGLESALVALGSDVMLAVEGAEDMATVLERLAQAGAESAVHAVAACLDLTAGGILGVLDAVDLKLLGSVQTLQEAGNFVETAPAEDVAGALDAQIDRLVDPSHLTDVLVNGLHSFSHLVLPLIDHIKM